MKNVPEDTQKALEILDPSKKETPQTSTPAVVSPRMTPRQEVENTLNYLNANYSLLENGLFIGKDTNLLIQVKAWVENQQKALQLQLAREIASEADRNPGAKS